MIYTCYEMALDCRADRAEGWSHFIREYVPVIQKLVAHYFAERADDRGWMESLVVALRQPESSLFQTLEPAPERWFVAELRQQLLAAADGLDGGKSPEIEIDLEALGAALEPLTVVEKQTTWLETMRYAPEETGVLLRMEPRTVEKIREKAAERIRGSMDNWRRSVLTDNGRQLGRAAAAAHTKDCLSAKAFLDVLDGRMTWRGREELERHVTACWHCIDHFCRMAEVVEVLRGVTPLSEPEAERFRQVLGVAGQAKPAWKRWFGKASGAV
ncbi:MAG: hypothetical protein LAP40_25900 [Acidobacteriia bacterium]|nr:hypothetical protein [Terriglobia bacterium]